MSMAIVMLAGGFEVFPPLVVSAHRGFHVLVFGWVGAAPRLAGALARAAVAIAGKIRDGREALARGTDALGVWVSTCHRHARPQVEGAVDLRRGAKNEVLWNVVGSIAVGVVDAFWRNQATTNLSLLDKDMCPASETTFLEEQVAVVSAHSPLYQARWV